MKNVGRAVGLGLLGGGIIGLLAGLLVHAIFGSNSALVGYEIVAALIGFIFGGLLGAFYAGVVTFGRDEAP